MTIFIAVCLFATATAFANVQVNDTNFPCENFRNWILAQPWGSDGVITDEEIEGITTINLPMAVGRLISDLTGINFFTNLRHLSISGGILPIHMPQLISIDVSGLTNLESLVVSNYQRLTVINASGLPNLTSLIVHYNNQLASLDISGLPNLETLQVDRSQLTSLDLSSSTNLQTLEITNNRQLTSIDVSGLTHFETLNLSMNALTSLDVSNLTNLTELNVSSNILTSIDVSNLPKLEVLNLQSNHLTSLDVSNLTNLRSLPVGGNQLTSLDVSNLTNLTWLSVWGNRLTSLDVSNLTSLTALTVGISWGGGNLISSLDVSNLTNLVSLNAYGNRLTSLDLLGLTNLATLDVRRNLMTDESDVIGFAGAFFEFHPQATIIEIDETNFPDPNFRNWLLAQPFVMDGILTNVDIPNIRVLEPVNQNITDLTGIEFFTNLQQLNASGNQLTSFNVSNLPNIRGLSLANNQLTSIEVSNLPNLQWLDVNHNQLTSLNVSSFTNLWRLNASGNQLTSFNVSNLPNIRELWLVNNQLTSIEVSNLPNLQWLDVNHNQLASLDLSNFTNLTRLSVENNQLTSLDVSNLTNLTTLFAGWNQLTSLDVSGLTNLEILLAWRNQLTSIDVSGLTNLINLQINHNRLTSLDISNLVNLRILSVGVNQLASIDVSNLTNLQELGLRDNLLTSLDVSNLTNLVALRLEGNQLTSLDVSGLNLWSLWVFNNYMRDHNAVIGFDDEWDVETASYWTPFRFNPQIRVITEINEENFPDENLRNWLLEQNDGNTDVYIRETVWIVPEDEICDDTEIIHTDVIEDCSWTASNIVSARIIEFGRIDNDLLPGNINCNNNQTQHDHAFAVWEIVREFGDGTQETITRRVYYCLDGRNPASTDNRPFLAFMSVVCVNPFYTGNNENNLRAVRQQTEISIHTFSALAVLNDGTNVVEIERAPILQLHPNPAQDFVNITADFPIRKIEIFSLSGIRVFAEENPTNRIDLRGFAKGVYFVRIYGNGGVAVTKRLIVR